MTAPSHILRVTFLETHEIQTSTEIISREFLCKVFDRPSQRILAEFRNRVPIANRPRLLQMFECEPLGCQYSDIVTQITATKIQPASLEDILQLLAQDADIINWLPPTFCIGSATSAIRSKMPVLSYNGLTISLSLFSRHVTWWDRFMLFGIQT